ncbi:MAG TPA: HprK-related kinase A [Candidatus Polarisedimenticolaceae bacterium]|nr:HprK-related kinase A [Candidatus Polarisedimenticolaceae bacterium]
MTVGELARADARGRAAGRGLAWEVGPFAVRLRTKLAAAVDGVRLLYADFPLCDNGTVVDAEFIVRRKRFWPVAVTLRVDGEIQYDWLSPRLVVPMLEWAMNVSVFQRVHQYLMLHSAVVARNGRAAILVGRAGSGKSTLCAGLVERGWRLLSDEVALVDPSDGRLRAVPRPISLKGRSIEVIRRFAPGATIGPSWAGTAKGTVAHVVPPRDSVARSAETAEPAWVIFPIYADGEDASMAPLARAQAFVRAVDNAFNYGVYGRSGFELLSAMIGRCPCFELCYGDLGRAVERIERLVADGGAV